MFPPSMDLLRHRTSLGSIWMKTNPSGDSELFGEKARWMRMVEAHARCAYVTYCAPSTYLCPKIHHWEAMITLVGQPLYMGKTCVVY